MQELEKYQLVVGLEVHIQLLTKSKLFCGDSTSFGAPPNTQVSAISLAHPGTLPQLNKSAIALAIRLGLALECEIQKHNYFARKHYFYPDLPKGYQVTQHTAPICMGGNVAIKTSTDVRNVKLNHIHLEEDAGKSIHDASDNFTSIDLNRAGVPLLEIVTEPDIFSAEEAYQFLTELRRLVRWLGVCDGNMEEGSMRCDANISIRLKSDLQLGTRVEVKNLNSIRNVKKAIEHEFQRLVMLKENKEPIIQETRSFDAGSNITFALRSKEEADDYRYFPEPDLPPVHITEEMLAIEKQSMPALPSQLEEEMVKTLDISAYDAAIICSDRADAEFYKTIIAHTKNHKAAANWFIGAVRNHCQQAAIEIKDFPISPEKISRLIELVENGKLNYTNASGRVFSALLDDPDKDPLAIATALNLLQESDTGATEAWVKQVLERLPEKVQEYKKGKKGLLGLFAGEVKKISKGKADMEKVNLILHQLLNQ